MSRANIQGSFCRIIHLALARDLAVVVLQVVAMKQFVAHALVRMPVLDVAIDHGRARGVVGAGGAGLK